MPLSICCPECKKNLRIKESAVGRRIRCPRCEAAIEVATADGASVPSAARPRRAKRLRRLQPLIAAGTIALVLLVAAAVGRSFFKESQPAGEAPETIRASADRTPTPAAEPENSRATAQPIPAASPMPRLPGAVTAPPAWLLTSGAPFDLAEFFRRPPPEKNAAPLYLDALLEFGNSVQECFPAAQVAARAKVAADRSERMRLPYERFMKDPKSVDRADLDRVCEEHALGFQKLAEAQQRPECVFETALDFTATLPHAQDAREVARVALLRNYRCLQSGDVNVAIGDIAIMLRLSRDLRRRAPMVSQLVSMTIDAICKDMIADVAGAKETTIPQCDRLLAELHRHRGESVDCFLEGLKTEYVMSRALLHDLEHKNGLGELAAVRQKVKGLGLGDPPGQTLGAMMSLLLDVGEPSKTKKFARRFDERLAAMTAESFQAEHRLADEMYRALTDAALKTDRQRIKEFDREFRRIRDRLQGIFYPAIGEILEARLRAHIRIGAAQCLLALRRWQLAKGSYPSDLAAAVRAAGMTGVPFDGYSDEPLRLGTAGGRPFVYSVGPDGVDDHGQRDAIADPQQKGDLVFRLGGAQR